MQENAEETPTPTVKAKVNLKSTITTVLYIVGALLLFLFALELMISSLQHLGRGSVQTIIQATSNPFTGLFIGLLITAMIQSSSTTTALVVAMVASGSLTIESAIPIIMGANVGTTITSTLVSLGFINKKKEFKRAVAAGTYHCFFNLLTVIILFPLEYYYRFLSSLSVYIADHFFVTPAAAVNTEVLRPWSGLNSVIGFFVELIPNGFVLILLSFALLFTSILVFRKIISNLLEASSPQAFSRFFFRSQIKSFFWGLLTTAAIRSSTITTSVVVPIVAKKIASLRQAAPFIMGANVGTTITAFIAATLNANTSGAISIAIVHFLFNFIGVLLFFPIPVLRKLPLKLASGLGQLTLKYRLAGFVFILITFFILPFSLIYLNQDSPKTIKATYERTDANGKTYFRLLARTNRRNQTGQWTIFNGKDEQLNEEPSLIYPVHTRNNVLFAGKDMFLFSRAGFCWNGEDDRGRYRACIDTVLREFTAPSALKFDSVYVYRIQHATAADTLTDKIYFGSHEKIILKREWYDGHEQLISKEEIVSVEVP